MLKKLVNEASFTLRITTTGPLLIKSGQPTISGPDMTPVLTFRNGQREVFLPGSSLKGVFRSHLEKITCSLNRAWCATLSRSGMKQKLIRVSGNAITREFLRRHITKRAYFSYCL